MVRVWQKWLSLKEDFGREGQERKTRGPVVTVTFRSVSVKVVSKSAWKNKTVLRPWMLAEGFYYKECATSLNKTNQPTTHSSPSLSQRLSLGNVTFSQEKSFSLIFSIPLHILYTTEDWWCFHLKNPTKYHSHSWTSWFHIQHRREGRTAGYWFYKLWQVNQQGWPDQTNQLGIKFCCCAHSAPGYIEKQPGWRRQDCLPV